MCESGAWKNFDELEESLTLDELTLLYERTSERQQRVMKMMAAAWGGGSEEDEVVHYSSGAITAGGTTLFGYEERKAEPEG